MGKKARDIGFFQYNDIGLSPTQTRKLIKLTESGILKIKFKTAKGGLHYELNINPIIIKEAIEIYKQQSKQEYKVNQENLDLRGWSLQQ